MVGGAESLGENISIKQNKNLHSLIHSETWWERSNFSTCMGKLLTARCPSEPGCICQEVKTRLRRRFQRENPKQTLTWCLTTRYFHGQRPSVSVSGFKPDRKEADVHKRTTNLIDPDGCICAPAFSRQYG